MDEQATRRRVADIQQTMRSGPPASSVELQRRLRAKFHAQQLDPAWIADICARLATGNAAEQTAIRRELVASGMSADDLRALGL